MKNDILKGAGRAISCGSASETWRMESPSTIVFLSHCPLRSDKCFHWYHLVPPLMVVPLVWLLVVELVVLFAPRALVINVWSLSTSFMKGLNPVGRT